MPRRCTVCSHPDRAGIDRAIVSGEAYRAIAGRYGLSRQAVQRHADAHTPATLAKAVEASEVELAQDLKGQIDDLQRRTLAILTAAEQSGEARIALAAVGEARRNVELLAKLLGDLQEGTTVTIHADKAWVELRTLVLQALQPYPEARRAVAEVLNGNS